MSKSVQQWQKLMCVYVLNFENAMRPPKKAVIETKDYCNKSCTVNQQMEHMCLIMYRENCVTNMLIGLKVLLTEASRLLQFKDSVIFSQFCFGLEFQIKLCDKVANMLIGF